MSLECNSSAPSTWNLSTHLEGLEITELRGTLEHNCEESSDFVLIFSIDGIQQWTSSMWHEDFFFHFRASSIITIELFNPIGTSAMASSNRTSLGSFSCRVVELLEDDEDIQIGSIYINVKLGPVKCADLVIFLDHKIPPVRVVHVLEAVVKSMMVMVDNIPSRIHRLKFEGQCHILFSVYNAWKTQLPSHGHILKLAECLNDLCARGRDELSKPVGDIVKITKAIGQLVIEVASFVDAYALLSLGALEDSWPEGMKTSFKTVRARCEDSKKVLNIDRDTARLMRSF